MKQKLNVAIQASNQKILHEDCLSCGEHINHPLCPQCIAKGFKKWIKKFPKEQSQIQRDVKKFLRGHKKFNEHSQTCVACGQNSAYLCPYCFTEYLYQKSKEAGLGVRALTEFLFIFNFDFKHNGYSQELEAYGGY